MLKISENAEKVLRDRYMQRDENGKLIEDAEGIFERVAGAVSEAEKLHGGTEEEADEKKKEFMDMMTNLEFLPNSPTLMNAGTGVGQLSACFVLPVEDTMAGIFETVKNTALIHKSGGGTGFSFSRLREEGAVIRSTGGEASGPVSFMHAFDAATETVKQGSRRRGANMGLLRVDHPDILKFIDCKKDKNVLNNFNLSVALTEEFMDAVREKRKYDLISPSTGEKTGSIDAEEVFEKIVTSAHYSGEPGIIFIDRMNRDNIVPEEGEIEATNPCVTADTKILTNIGYIPIIELAGQPATVWNGSGFSMVVPKMTGRNKRILRVRLSNGKELKCTRNHKFILEDGSRVPARKLKSGDSLKKCAYPFMTGKESLENAYTQGFYAGSERLMEKDAEIIMKEDKSCCRGRLKIKSAKKNAKGNIKREVLELDVSHPADFVPGGSFKLKDRLDWLSGLLDAKGAYYVSDGAGVYVRSEDEEFITNLVYLFNSFGEDSEIKALRAAPENRLVYETGLTNAEFTRLESFGLQTSRICLDSCASVDKKDKLRVENITELPDREDVYCFTEPVFHQGVFNGILTGQCGEQPLLPYESCNLGSINLAKMLKTENGAVVFDKEKLERTVKSAVNFLDNVIDVNRYPLEIIERTTKATRKIGLGIMGWADALLLMGIPYSSEKAARMAEKLMKFIRDKGREESVRLAKVRGEFPLYKRSIYPTLKTGKLRNGTITTIAPTGSISIIADCSSGMEPVFAFVYTRNISENPERFVNPVLAEKLRALDLLTDDILDRIEKEGSLQHIEEIPEEIKRIFVCAHDITPEEHVRMQAAFQAGTDNAVSKTVNFRSDATIDEVREVFLLADRLGCKGVTIYRDKSRENQTLNIGGERSQEHYCENTPRKRPKVVSGITEKVKIGCGNLYVTVNCDPEGLCEVMTTTGKEGGCPSQSDAVSILISTALRGGISPETLIEKLRGIRCPATLSRKGKDKEIECLSCPDAIGRVMQRELEKEKDMMAENISLMENLPESSPQEQEGSFCPECGRPLRFEEGCRKCICGFSLCGG